MPIKLSCSVSDFPGFPGRERKSFLGPRLKSAGPCIDEKMAFLMHRRTRCRLDPACLFLRCYFCCTVWGPSVSLLSVCKFFLSGRCIGSDSILESEGLGWPSSDSIVWPLCSRPSSRTRNPRILFLDEWACPKRSSLIPRACANVEPCCGSMFSCYELVVLEVSVLACRVMSELYGCFARRRLPYFRLNRAAGSNACLLPLHLELDVEDW